MDFKTGRPNHIEDYLSSCDQALLEGDFYEWKNLNGDDANKIYANLVVHTQWGFTKPTEQECIDGLAQMQTDFDQRIIDKKASRDSAKAKLEALGLTTEEIKDSFKL